MSRVLAFIVAAWTLFAVANETGNWRFALPGLLAIGGALAATYEARESA